MDVSPFSAPSAAAFEVLEFMNQVEPEPVHTQHVARLAGELFDGLSGALPSEPDGQSPRFTLISAALLHDIGWSRSEGGKGHHKHSAAMIREHRWTNLSPHEVERIAIVARYHRKSPPSQAHPEFAACDSDTKTLIRRLAGILRVADALDRSHTQRITRLTPEIDDDRVILHVAAAGSLDMEAGGVAKKSDVFEQAFGKVVELRRHS